MKKSVRINAILNVARQAVSVIFPLFTFPYLIRVLGATNYGKANYVSSIVIYFTLAARFGFSAYATREGARLRGNRERLNRYCSEVFTLNVATTVLASAALLILVLCVEKFREYQLLFLILGFNVTFTALQIDWVNVVFEDYLYITVRGILIHAANFALIFLLIRKPQDYYIWALLNVMNSGAVCVLNWLYIRRYVTIRATIKTNGAEHLKKALVFFAYDITTAIYVNFDTTMLGWLRGDYEVGLYTVSVRIYLIAKNVLAAIYAVGIPRLSAFYGGGKYTEFRALLSQIICSLSVLVIPACLGLALFSGDILVLLGGDEYIQSQSALKLLAFAMVFAIYNGIIITCINVPSGHERVNMAGSILSAALNFVLNLYFIPKYSINGAALTTLISETFLMFYCFFGNKEAASHINIGTLRETALHIAFGCIPIICCTYLSKRMIEQLFPRLAVGISTSVVFYFLCMLLMNDKTVVEFKESIINRIKSYR